MPDIYQTFHIGVNVIVLKENRLLLGKRINVHGAGTWGLPGGHLETGEAMVGAAARELMEETGLQAERYEFSNIFNDRNGKLHYVQVGFIAHGVTGEIVLKEPDRCEAWEWFELNDLPKEILPSHIPQIENFIQKVNFSDA
jgi:8-oxo-dGTP diphosphatase